MTPYEKWSLVSNFMSSIPILVSLTSVGLMIWIKFHYRLYGRQTAEYLLKEYERTIHLAMLNSDKSWEIYNEIRNLSEDVDNTLKVHRLEREAKIYSKFSDGYDKEKWQILTAFEIEFKDHNYIKNFKLDGKSANEACKIYIEKNGEAIRSNWFKRFYKFITCYNKQKTNNIYGFYFEKDVEK